MFALGGELIFGVVVWGAMFWGAIYLLDRENPHNRFAQALAVSVVRVVVSFFAAFNLLFGFGALAVWLVVMIRILLNYYDLGIAKTLGVLALMVAVPYAVMPVIVEWIGDSELRAAAFVYGLPSGIIGTWLYLRHRAASADLPEARVVSPSELPAVPVVPQLPAAASPPPPPAEPPAPPKTITPVAPVRTSAPLIVEQASAEDGPKFLR